MALTREELDERIFRKGQVFHVLYSSRAEAHIRQIAIQYVNDPSAGYTYWFDYYDDKTEL